LADVEKSVQTRIVLIFFYPKKLRQTIAGAAATGLLSGTIIYLVK
jgi:hypothetical protein